MSPIPFAAALAASVVPPLLVMGVLRCCVERFWPAGEPRTARGGLNIFAMMGWMASQAALAPVFNAMSVRLTNAVGGGFVVLPSKGWGLLAGVVAWVLITDFCEYAFHWLEHKVPAFWAMHSLHHADRSYDSTTAVLHHWGSAALHSVLIAVPLGLIFKVSPNILVIYAFIGGNVYLMHSNLRLNFGRWSWAWTSPSYHRLHHSVQPEHFDCNYAFLLPIYDIAFRTYRRPGKAEWPATGLDTGEAPATLADIVVWPVRGWFARRGGSARALA